MFMSNRIHPAWCFFVTLVGITLATFDRGTTAIGQPDAHPQRSPSQTEFYQPDEVQSVYLKVTDENMQRLLAALPERISVPASFRWREISIDNVAIRFKGNSSANPSQQHKRSFLIKFDEYDSDVRFLGLRRVSFDNGVQFGSLFSEPIITEILQDLGIKTHRCNYAKLYLNDKYQGVYVNVERIDETFLARHFPDPEGLLFKVHEGGPGSNLQYLGPEPASYTRAFSPENRSAKRGQQRLVEFIRMINETSPNEFPTRLESATELDEFLKITAVMLFSGAFDQLTGWNPHNYYLLYDTKQERWHYLPWDLDVGFCEVAFGQIRVLADWNAAWPAPGQLPNPLLDRIVANPELLQRYRKIASEILDQYFEPQRLSAILDAKYKLIQNDLQTDPFPHKRVTNPEDRSYDDVVTSMKRFIQRRHAIAHQQLETPGKKPAMSRMPQGGPPPQLIGKIQRVMRAAEQMQKNGQDVTPVQRVMERVGPLMQQGKLEEVNRLVDEAHKLTGAANE